MLAAIIDAIRGLPGRSLRRAGLILCFALVCALGAGAVSARADDAPPPAAPASTQPAPTEPAPTEPAPTEPAPTEPAPTEPATIAYGVRIGPVAVGGLTAHAATRVVLQAYLSRIDLDVAGRRISVLPRSFRIEVPVAAAVERALEVRPGKTVGLRATVDQTLLFSYVESLAKRFDRTPVSSRLLLRHIEPVVTTARPGLAIRLLPTRMRLRNELREGLRGTIKVPTRVLKAKVEPEAKGPVIVIRRGSNRLSLYRGAKLVRTFPVATGQAAYPTPLGRFQIVVMWKNPTWYPPTQDDWAKGLQPVPPGPGNPLGTRWMGISSPGVGIHGTDDPDSIGYSVSHGCIRMQVPSAEWLFDHVTIGTPVYIVPQ